VTLIVAPTEPALLKEIANVVSMAPERYGVDVMWSSLGWGLCGVQRKTVQDFVASVHDGRLGKESQQMQRLGLRVLMLEGRARWTNDGMLADGYVRWSRKSHYGLLRSLQAKGIWVEFSNDTRDTVELVKELIKWANKERHLGLEIRPGPAKDEWGKISSRGYAMHLLQGLDGVGVDLAGKIIDHFGRAPVQWGDDVTVEELCKVDGIGKLTAEKLIVALGGSVPSSKPRKRRTKTSLSTGPTT
jgi:ERCC4-type nuclease